MAMRAILQPSSIAFSVKTTQNSYLFKPITINVSSTSLDYPSSSTAPKKSTSSNNWQWKFKDNSVNIYYEEHRKESKNTEQQPTKNILMIPTISDVSTVEEWRTVAKDIVARDGNVNYKATIVDWPGL